MPLQEPTYTEEAIQNALKEEGGSVKKASIRLGCHIATIYNCLNKNKVKTEKVLSIGIENKHIEHKQVSTEEVDVVIRFKGRNLELLRWIADTASMEERTKESQILWWLKRIKEDELEKELQ